MRGQRMHELTRDYLDAIALAGRYEIRSIPTILFVKDGRVVDTVIGAVPRAALDAKVAKHLSP